MVWATSHPLATFGGVTRQPQRLMYARRENESMGRKSPMGPSPPRKGVLRNPRAEGKVPVARAGPKWGADLQGDGPESIVHHFVPYTSKR